MFEKGEVSERVVEQEKQEPGKNGSCCASKMTEVKDGRRLKVTKEPSGFARYMRGLEGWSKLGFSPDG